MGAGVSKQYDLDLDYFIIKQALNKKNMGYRELFREIGEKHRPISYETFNRHINHLKVSEWVDRDAKYSQYYLTEKCKLQLELKALMLVPPIQKLDDSYLSSSLAAASKRINVYILLLLLKSESTYEFEKREELEYFLSLFGLSMNSLNLKSGGGALHKSKMEVYKLEGVFESEDGRVLISKRRIVSSPHRPKNSISLICIIKGVKYPMIKYRSDPFRYTDITREDIIDSLSLLSTKSILREPVEYEGDSIYLFNDQHLYDLLFELNVFCYSWAKSTLLQIWYVRRPELEEKYWLQKIEGESSMTKYIDKARKHRERVGLPHHKKVELMTNIIHDTSIYIKGFEEQLKKEYHDTLSDPRYEFIIQELKKFVLPNWLRRIKTYKSRSRPKKNF